MKRLTWLLVAASFFIPTAAQAGFMVGFVGNTQPASVFPDLVGGPSVQDGTINFAVLVLPAGSTWATELGFTPTFSAGTTFDTTAQYLYLYQVVNNGPGTQATGRTTVTLNIAGTALTSYGYFSGVSLTDNSGLISTTNNFGTDGLAFGDASGTDPANIGVTTPGFSTGVTGLIDPLVFGITDFTSFASFLVTSGFADNLTDGKISSVFGFTSNLAPTYDVGSIQDGTTGDGTVPTPVVPEPSTLSLFGIGLACGAFFWRRKKTAMDLDP